MKLIVYRDYARTATLLVLALLVSFTIVRAQPPATQAQDAKAPAKETTGQEKKAPKKPGFVWTIKTRPILNLSLKAEKANMAEVAQALSEKLKIPVFLGPERQKEVISIEFSELTLEPALQLMSPTVYVDYELDTGSTNPPKPLGIFFYDTNQGEPPVTAVVTGTNQSMLIEGNTEDGVEPTTDEEKQKLEEQPLRVRYENRLLSVKAKQQPLPLILLKIGEELGIPVDIQNERLDPVDANISKLPIEDVARQLSPHIKLYYRADLTRAEKRALRMVLAEPPKATQGP
ncbi:MAG TPA: hypothetical protein VN844_23195 [Pyrinomonadaceae bacterium]|nr:hypothetical protein [Pyrinomonadaceae bacterium]